MKRFRSLNLYLNSIKNKERNATDYKNGEYLRIVVPLDPRLETPPLAWLTAG